MTRFYPLFKELGVRPASELVNLPGGIDSLVAGVRRATHTPPMRSGTVFHTHYVLIRERTRRTGARGVSVTGEGLCDLLDVVKTVAARRSREREDARVVVEAKAADNVIQMWKRRA